MKKSQKSLDIYKQVSGATDESIAEAIGDNKVDNMVDDLARVTAIEINLFVSQMLVQNAGKFLFHYNMPAYEEFRTSFKDVITRYLVMDGEEKGDLFAKIENMFKVIFSENFSAMGPEVSATTATIYATQMVKILKSMSVQANTEMFAAQGPI